MTIDLSKLKRFALDKAAPALFEQSGGKFVRFEDVKKLVEEAAKDNELPCSQD